MTWRDRLRRAMDKQGISMKRLSLHAGLGETFVRDMMSRGSDPVITHFAAIARVLGMTIGELYDEPPAKPRAQPEARRVA